MNELVIFEGVNLNNAKTQMDKIGQFQSLVRSQFTDKLDYGVVPGSKKLSLLKPGAEKILMLLGLTSEFEIANQIRDYENGLVLFDFVCSLYSNGTKITQGFGSANSKEAKFEKNAVYSIDNTIMKMAKKRALVDAALLVGSLSDIFTQDIDEMDDLSGNKATEYKQQATDTSGLISQAQAKRLFALSGGNGDIVKSVMEKHGYSGKSTDIQKLDYEKIAADIEAEAKANQ